VFLKKVSTLELLNFCCYNIHVNPLKGSTSVYDNLIYDHTKCQNMRPPPK
jgi:hypothetical protein